MILFVCYRLKFLNTHQRIKGHWLFQCLPKRKRGYTLSDELGVFESHPEGWVLLRFKDAYMMVQALRGQQLVLAPAVIKAWTTSV